MTGQARVITQEDLRAAFSAWWDSDDDLYLYDLWKSLEKDFEKQQKQEQKK